MFCFRFNLLGFLKRLLVTGVKVDGGGTGEGNRNDGVVVSEDIYPSLHLCVSVGMSIVHNFKWLRACVRLIKFISCLTVCDAKYRHGKQTSFMSDKRYSNLIMLPCDFFVLEVSCVERPTS